jgi:hypothetical protein
MFSFHGVDGECHGSQDLRYGNDGLSLGSEEELAWCFITWSSCLIVGAEKFIVLSVRVKIQGLTLIDYEWQCLY